MIPVIEHRELGGNRVERSFVINEVSAYLALQIGTPKATIRARIIEGHGYCKRPPKSGEKIICMGGRLYSVDDNAIRAAKRVIFDFVSEWEMHAIVGAYLVEENGDAYRPAGIHLDNEVHPHVVITVLDTLRDQGRLPAHPS